MSNYYDVRRSGRVSYSPDDSLCFGEPWQPGTGAAAPDEAKRRARSRQTCRLRKGGSGWQLTRFKLPSRVEVCLMSITKIQVGQLWKKDGTGEIYLVTRLYSEALNTMVILRKSGSEGEAQIRVRVERAGNGQKIPGFSPAQEDESF